ncbi:MAG TPA: hypothetical protein VFW77_03675 [Candidatus Saccharimonadales bacterium]|nr:hypothetical protein [Candidatus Saccharimonadales bacterium]
MADEKNKNPGKPGGNYGKRPAWQWILLYIIAAIIVYGLIYYFFIKDNGGGGNSGGLSY